VPLVGDVLHELSAYDAAADAAHRAALAKFRATDPGARYAGTPAQPGADSGFVRLAAALWASVGLGLRPAVWESFFTISDSAEK